MINSILAASVLALFSQIALPPTASVEPGRLIKISATTDGKVIRWINTSANADLIVADSGQWAIFSSPVAGEYKVFCWTSINNLPTEAAICVVTVGAVQPPIPVNNELWLRVQEAYTKEQAATKRAEVAQLIKGYEAVCIVLAGDPIATAEDFITKSRAETQKYIPLQLLPALRAVIATDLATIIDSEPGTKIDQKKQAEIRAAFLSYIVFLRRL